MVLPQGTEKGEVMGQRLIVQPNGRFAVFSSYTDDIIYYDCDVEELVGLYRKEAADKAEEETRRWCAAPGPGRNHYTVEQAVEWVRFRHGDKEAERVREMLTKEDL